LNVGFWILLLLTANEAFEKVASYGLIPNMILYLMRDYSVGVAKGTNILFLWTAGTNFMPILGALISDSYLGRFLTIGLGSISSLLVLFFSFHDVFFFRSLSFSGSISSII
jgi:peptide/histidine transporter 3/4